MYAVVGATGNTGRVVAEALLAAGEDVQVVGRTEERLQPLVGKGAEAFVGSVDDAQAMTLAFSGAVGLYCLIPPCYDVPDFRAYQRKVSESLAAAVHRAGVEYVINLSSVGAQHTEGTGPIAGLREQEDRLNALEGVNVLHLRAGWFMENFLMSVETVRSMGVLGTPVRGDVPIPMIATRDVGSYAAERLLKLDFSGKSTRELLGPRDVTLAEAARALGAAIGNEDLGYAQLPYEDVEKRMMEMGISRGVAGLMSEMYRAFNDGLVAPCEERAPENTTPTTIEEFAQVFARAYQG